MRRLAFILLLGCSSSTPAKAPMKEEAKKEPDIVQIGKPVLRSRATEVPKEKLGTKEMDDLVAKMIETMRAAPGVGLAAPQIGVPLRVIVLEDRPELMSKLTDAERRERERVAFGPRVFVNPVVTPVGEERAMFFEGCLSVRGYVGLVDRAAEVEVTGTDEKGTPQTWRVRGWPARILQHELDHLDGTLYVDRMVTRSFSNADHAKELYAGKPIAEVKRMMGIAP
jgi:peptide deformylase